MRKRRGMLRLFACVAVVVQLVASACGEDRPFDPSTRRLGVLFIGSSLTYWNDMPRIVEALFVAAGFPTPRIEMLADPGAGLEWHWSQSETHRVIEEGAWDVVILEQGSSYGADRADLIEYSTLFAQEIRSAWGEPALYMVWPSADRLDDFGLVSDSYRMAAAEVDGLLFPVGEAWRAALRLLPSLQLYGADGLHPSVLGSYLAALVMFEGLTGASPIGLPSTLEVPGSAVRIEVSPEETAALQAAAVEANAKFGIGLTSAAPRAAANLIVGGDEGRSRSLPGPAR